MSDEPSQQGQDPEDPSGGPAEPSAHGGSPPGEPAYAAPAGAPAPAVAARAGKGKRPRRRRTGWRRLLPTWRMVLFGVLAIVVIVVGGFIAGYYLVDIPRANAAAVAQSNVYLYKDGTPIARDGDINRENVSLAQVPRTVQRAVLAAEDREFYGEPAVDPLGMARAAWNTVTGKGTQGGSTITQQYVKNYYLGQEQTLLRKAKEFFISVKLNRERSKAEILQGYLNTSYFGRNAYGIQAASQAYYGKDVEQIDTAQGAYLASLLNAPSQFDVIAHPENKGAATARWNYVLDGMVKKHWLTEAARTKLTFPTPSRSGPSNAGLSGQRGYIVQAVKDYLTSHKIIDDGTLASGGYRITTTLQRPRQNALVKAVDDNVNSKLKPDDRPADKNVRIGGASIDPSTGDVVAMYGGIDYTKQYVDNATRRDYQVGSTFKPFVLASAIQNGSETQDGDPITPNTHYNGDNHRMVQGPNGPTGYAPANEDDRDYGDITVRTATNKSVNAVYAQLAEDVGPSTVEHTAIDLGIPATTPDLTATPSIALGPATASVLDMTQAYATLAHHGVREPYTLVARITKDGAAVALPARRSAQAVSRQAADTTTSVLRTVVDSSEGTGTAARAAGRPAAGKTGTAEDDRAAWFAGYTPDLTTVVAMMGADPATARHKALYGALGQARVNGGGPPAQIWGQYTAAALKGSPVQSFDLHLQHGAEQRHEPSGRPSDEPSGPGSSAPGDTGGDTGGRDTGGTSTGGTDDGGATDGGTDGGPTGGDTDGGTPNPAGGQTATTGGDTTGGTDGGTDTGGTGTGAGGTDTGGTGDGGTTGGTTDGGTAGTGGTAGPGPGGTGGTAGPGPGGAPPGGTTPVAPPG
ncbi:transglycosylase domain-containing protein [Streptomyces sp. 8L]|uniref:transglycosylase domain-containing protein n=1 Tax=Streptomyces sp. 8L TaxID=2877242 RepID=UPI001CD5CF72|nr:transglycosylase domain-containing protein [Streptomyces sp. 8L]MCA1219935.1 penicillin-binding protein [Streptomyces sp. 8L]